MATTTKKTTKPRATPKAATLTQEIAASKRRGEKPRAEPVKLANVEVVGRVTTPLLEQVIEDRVIRQLVKRSFDGATPEMVRGAINSLRNGIYRDYADLAAKMFKDPVVRRGDRWRRDAVGGRPFVINAPPDAKDDPQAMQAADVWRSKSKKIQGFRSVRRKMLSGLTMGLAVAELIWEWVEGWWVVTRIEMHDIRNCEWTLEGGLGIRDKDNTLHRIADYPGKFWVFIPTNVAGDATEQGDLLAACYFWVFKTWGWKFWLIAAERFGNPLAMGYVPRGSGIETRQALVDQLLQLSADSVGVFDNEAKVEVMEPKGGTSGETWSKLVGALDEQTMIALCGSPDLLKQGDSAGGYANSQTKDGMRLESSTQDAADFCDSFDRDVTAWFFYFNRPKFAKAPTLPEASVTFESEVKPEALVAASAGGVTIYENEHRRALGLGPTEGGDTKVVTPPAAAGGFGQSFEAPRGGGAASPLPSTTTGQPTSNSPPSTSGMPNFTAMSSHSPMNPIRRALSSA